MFSQSFLLDVGQEMESRQPEKRNDKCDEIKSDTTEDKTVFELEDDTEVRFDDKEIVDNQRNDKWEEITSYTSEEKLTFGIEYEKEIFDNKESVQTETNTNSELELYIDHDKMINTLDDENKVDTLESIDRNLNLDIFDKWMKKIFPPNLKLNLLKLSNYSEDDNISNEATYARLIVMLIFITVVLCFIMFGQLIWILVLSRGPIVVQRFIPNGNNPFCKKPFCLIVSKRRHISWWASIVGARPIFYFIDQIDEKCYYIFTKRY